MQDEVLSCGEARLLITSAVEGEPASALESHLANCEPCLDAWLEAALQRPIDVRVPAKFRETVLARLPAEPPKYRWIRTSTVIAAVGAALWCSWGLPVVAALRDPMVLAAAVAIETGLSLLWLWRTLRERPAM